MTWVTSGGNKGLTSGGNKGVNIWQIYTFMVYTTCLVILGIIEQPGIDEESPPPLGETLQLNGWTKWSSLIPNLGTCLPEM